MEMESDLDSDEWNAGACLKLQRYFRKIMAQFACGQCKVGPLSGSIGCSEDRDTVQIDEIGRFLSMVVSEWMDKTYDPDAMDVLSDSEIEDLLDSVEKIIVNFVVAHIWQAPCMENAKELQELLNQLSTRVQDLEEFVSDFKKFVNRESPSLSVQRFLQAKDSYAELSNNFRILSHYVTSEIGCTSGSD